MAGKLIIFITAAVFAVLGISGIVNAEAGNQTVSMQIDNTNGVQKNDVSDDIRIELLTKEEYASFAKEFEIAARKNLLPAADAVTIKELIVKYARELNIDPELALSIAKAESNFHHNKVSRCGAAGVFQLMPSTAKKMGYNVYSLHDNIKAGITYYKKMYDMFGSVELALAAYNAGPGNVKKYGGIPPFAETRNFVASIMNNYAGGKKTPAADNKPADSIENGIKEINNIIAEENYGINREQVIQDYLSEQGV